MKQTVPFLYYALFLTLPAILFGQEKKVIKIGMIGLDTSHAPAFTKIINSNQVPGGKVVAAVPQKSDDIESSYTRIDKYTTALKDEYGVKMYDTIEAMLPHVDAVMVESVDGRPHLAQAKPCLEAGKPVFIDKPMCASLKDVIEIFEISKKTGTPVWSSSNLRYHDGVKAAAANEEIGEKRMVLSFGPASLEKNHIDLAWYGIHSTEALFTVMGTGCVSVSRTHTEGQDLVTGLWEDGRIGSVLGIREGKAHFGIKLFGTKAMAEEKVGGAYPGQMEAVMKFFQTGEVPVTPEETIEIFAFMEAADVSKERGGAPVKLSEVIEAAKSGK
ncbi:MAG: Gfo/Idh/MocA family oxidoreductase [Verrucomicrobiales bacterium]|nr:Gfo/Idh/MocA family oxidoreductase [Verrucomicrobiales bacterium]